MGPGMSYYLITFKFEGFWYCWDNRVKGYFNLTTRKVFKSPPVGATWDDDCWVSQWRVEDEDGEEDVDEFYG